LLPGIRDADLQAAVLAPQVTQTGLRSPWLGQHSHLAQITWAGLFGTDVAPVTRAEAMSVPAYARARSVLTSIIPAIPLRAYRGPLDADVTSLPRVDPQPSWINGTNQAVAPALRMIQTVDDLLFYGVSCWSRVNGAADRSARAYPIRMDRLPIERWTINPDGHVCVDNLDGRGHQPVRADEVCLIPGPHEGLLVYAAEAIRQAKDLEKAVARASNNPTPHTELRQVAGDPMTDEQIDAMLTRYAARRRMTDGAVSFLNSSIESKGVGSFDGHMMLGGRNAAAVDAARNVGLPADVVDAAGEASLTYANVRDNDKRVLSYGASSYLLCISGALSQDGVSPHGQRVAFDIEAWLGSTPTATTPTTPTPPRPAQEPAE
jgi:hypothetical protein